MGRRVIRPKVMERQIVCSVSDAYVNFTLNLVMCVVIGVCR